MMELQDELKSARAQMLNSTRSYNKIAIASGCDLFLRYTTRTFLEFDDFETSKQEVLERGQRFASLSLAARDRISTVGQDFIQEGSTVLVHGTSRVVASILQKASKTKHFDIIVLEGRPDCAGVETAKAYSEQGIPTTVILDSAMAYIMEQVDIVLVGAEAIVENGGCVNKMGTYAVALCAQAHSKPFYVACESYKFARLYPLNQQDLPHMITGNGSSGGSESQSNTDAISFVDTTSSGGPKVIELPSEVQVQNSPCDFTPAKFITLLFTDLGVLTPSAVSDELIRLYQ
jgi:translation initiation factor eIF-2B subunit alpha